MHCRQPQKAGKLAVFSVAVLLVLVCLLVLLRPAGQTAPTFSNVSVRSHAAPSSHPAASKSAQYKRDDLRTLVLGKNNDQVLHLLGKPLRTLAISGAGEFWYHGRLTYDPSTGEADTAPCRSCFKRTA